MHVAVMGCVVNGPGESKRASIGIFSSRFGRASGSAGICGRRGRRLTLKGETIAEDFQRLVDDYVAATYAGDSAARARLAAPAKKGRGGDGEADSDNKTIPIRWQLTKSFDGGCRRRQEAS